MNDFLQRLVDLRNNIPGPGAIAKSVGGAASRTLGNVGKGIRNRSQERLDNERARNAEMIRQNFGSPENYQRLQEESNTPSPTIGPFFARLLGLRQDK
jgi:hypothetical protein